MQLASFGIGPPQKAAMSAVETKETSMRAYSLNELFRLTRTELFALHAKIASELAALPDHSVDRSTAFANLRNIRSLLAQRKFAPG